MEKVKAVADSSRWKAPNRSRAMLHVSCRPIDPDSRREVVAEILLTLLASTESMKVEAA